MCDAHHHSTRGKGQHPTGDGGPRSGPHKRCPKHGGSEDQSSGRQGEFGVVNGVGRPVEQVPVAHEQHEEKTRQQRGLCFLRGITVLTVESSGEPVTQQGHADEPGRKVKVDDGRNEQHVVGRGEEIGVFEHPKDRGEANPRDERQGHSLVGGKVPLPEERLQQDDATQHAEGVNRRVLWGVTGIPGHACVLDHRFPDDGSKRFSPHRVERQRESGENGQSESNGRPDDDFFRRRIHVVGERRGEGRQLGLVCHVEPSP